MSASIDDLFEKKEFNPFENADLDPAKQYLATSLTEHGHACNLVWLVEKDSDENDLDSRSTFINKYSVSLIVQQNQDNLSDDALLQCLELTDEEIKVIEEGTRGQRSNPVWSNMRQSRLTASNFGRVLKAIRNNTSPSSLFMQLKGK